MSNLIKLKYKLIIFSDLIFESDIVWKLLQKYVDGILQGNLLFYGFYGSLKFIVVKFIVEW